MDQVKNTIRHKIIKISIKLIDQSIFYKKYLNIRLKLIKNEIEYAIYSK
jgi:hypothetical protein